MIIYIGILCLVIFKELPAQTTPTSNLLAPRTYCGYQHTDDYPRTNNSISIDEFPWSVQLLYSNDKKIRCSGSLISRRYVLTAAQCLNDLIGVRLGDYNVTSDKDCTENKYGTECSDPVQYFEIEEKIEHPAYIKLKSTHDIALLRLAKDVMYSEYIRPICLPTSPTEELSKGKQFFTTGWGQLGEELNQTEIKKKVETTLLPWQKCEGISFDLSVKESFLCVKEKHALTCHGDGGAPLMSSNRNQWEQVGILVYKTTCSARKPAVYVKVSHYIMWIIYSLRP